ncbi:MAG: O-acetylhomoserine aminocarboxypropyltransferase/cysteine synthase, partial [Elusimicrobia bacterium]|nr:O-acetylhomoserine aminocarboxypropyltransferase/cysteine synthase [Elusimicrobiota bacterium]
SRGVPVYRTTSYLFKDTKHAARLFALEEEGNLYSRIMNPTHDILEKRVTSLEGGAASVAFASGTAAIFNTVINIARKGDEIVSASNLYGGSYTMFDTILPDFGIKVRFVNPDNPDNFRKAINDKTKLIFIETIGNPSLNFTDISAVAEIANQFGLPLVVDGTFTSPYLLRTIEHGAHIVINSLTKWLGGHGAAIGGIVTASGNFNWKSEKFPLYTEPDPSYQGLRWAYDIPEKFKEIAFALRLRNVPLRNLGSCITPDNAWIFLQGIETLHLRMPRHSENALKVAEFLKDHPLVEWVRYPGLIDDPSYKVASQYLDKGFGGMVVFGIKGGLESGRKFIESLKLFSHLANVGDAKSLALHPASTTHSQLTEDQQLTGSLTPDLIRLSIGLEDIEDILWDIKTGLDSIKSR